MQITQWYLAHYKGATALYIHCQMVTNYSIFESIVYLLVRGKVTRLRLHLRNNNIVSLESPKRIWLRHTFLHQAYACICIRIEKL